MELITISEFRHLTQLSPADVLTMLENGELKLSTSANGELLIDISSLSTAQLATRRAARAAEISSGELALLEERIASVITEKLETIVEEALELAVKWQAQGAYDASSGAPSAQTPKK